MLACNPIFIRVVEKITQTVPDIPFRKFTTGISVFIQNTEIYILLASICVQWEVLADDGNTNEIAGAELKVFFKPLGDHL